MDWSGCALVEMDPHIHSGAPVLRGTRLPVSAIIGNFEYGASIPEISEWFDVPRDQVRAILSYFEEHYIAGVVR